MVKYLEGADALAHYLRTVQRNFRHWERLKEARSDHPIHQTLVESGEQLLSRSLDQSPEWTGWLMQNHMLSDVDMQASGSATVTGQIDVYINPDPSRKHPIIKSSWPGEYGPRYHQEKRPWLYMALADYAPLFERNVRRMRHIIMTETPMFPS